MHWSGKTKIADGLSATDTEVFSDYVTLFPDEVAIVQVKADFSGVPTDDLVVSQYFTLDPETEQSDNVPIKTADTVDKATDPSYKSYVIEKCYKFRLGFKASGAADTITVDAWVMVSKN